MSVSGFICTYIAIYILTSFPRETIMQFAYIIYATYQPANRHHVVACRFTKKFNIGLIIIFSSTFVPWLIVPIYMLLPVAYSTWINSGLVIGNIISMYALDAFTNWVMDRPNLADSYFNSKAMLEL